MEKPNVLVLFTDQQRFDTIHSLGHSHMITPNLDRLVKSGVSYTQAHTTNPVCVPARHDLLTGLSGQSHGFFNNNPNPIKDAAIPTIPRIFLNNGYRTAAVGKCHHQPTREHHGYGEMHLMEEVPKRRQDDQYATFLKESGREDITHLHGLRAWLLHEPQNSQMDSAQHPNTWVADRTIQWLEENKDEPFYLFASWIAPHPPWHLPPEYQGLYRDKELPEPIPPARRFPFSSEHGEWFGDEDSPTLKRCIREFYYASITMVDENIGRVLDYLEENALLENTLILFASDHGEMLQDRGLYTKQLPYDGSVRIPMVIRYPKRFEPNTQCCDFVDLFDILPTCLDVCGLEYPESQYTPVGESLCSDAPQRNRSVQCSSNGKGANRWLMIRNQRYKYIYWYKKGTREFYDLENDPHELNNLMETNEYSKELVNTLHTQLIEYELELGMKELVEAGELIRFESDAPFRKTKNNKFPDRTSQEFHIFNQAFNTPSDFKREFDHARKGLPTDIDLLKKISEDEEWGSKLRASWKRAFGDSDFKRVFD